MVCLAQYLALEQHLGIRPQPGGRSDRWELTILEKSKQSVSTRSVNLSLEEEQTWFCKMKVPAAAEPGCAEAVTPLSEGYENGEEGWDLYSCGYRSF